MSERADRRSWGAIPERMARRPSDHRGYPVPWFVHQRSDGSWDFRIIRKHGVEEALRRRTCWLCGESLGRFVCFTVGPMCVVNRITSEPPAHLDCALFAVRACPFLTRPAMRRNEKGMEGFAPQPGFAALDNPGGAAIVTTRFYEAFAPQRGQPGILIRFGEPESVAWFVHGRAATHDEAREVFVRGAVRLHAIAKAESPIAEREVIAAIKVASRTLPPPEAGVR